MATPWCKCETSEQSGGTHGTRSVGCSGVCSDSGPIVRDDTWGALSRGASFSGPHQDAHLTTPSGCPLREVLKGNKPQISATNFLLNMS